jgi:hypothetical protein
MADFLSEKRAEIDRKLEELRPLHEEYLKLERAKSALDGLAGGRRRGPGRPRGSRTRAASGNGRRRRRGRPRGGGRATEALEHVRKNPGITVAELADRLGMKQRNYLYRVMSNLQSEGAVKKRGRGFYAG